MPELPEVEIVMRGLSKALSGQRFVKCHLYRSDLRLPLPDNMKQRLIGTKVIHLSRRGKYILCALNTNETLLIHLGMSGHIRIIFKDQTATDSLVKKHDHVTLLLNSGVWIIYHDPRRFGMIDLVASAIIGQHRLLCKLGVEPLSNQFNETYLLAHLSKKKATIKSILLNQRVIAGIGNIYAAEALWRSRISPCTRGGDLHPRQVRRLVIAIREVLFDAIKAGGSSLKDYRHTDGALGYFQNTFAVYNRAGQSCTTQGCNGIIKRINQSGRSSFYCPMCQP